MKFLMLVFMILSVSCKPTQSLQLEPYKNKSTLYKGSEGSKCEDALERDFSIDCVEKAQLAGVIPAYRFDEIHEATKTGACFIGTVTRDEVAAIKDGGFCMGSDYSKNIVKEEKISESLPSDSSTPAASPASSGECRYVDKCWGFSSRKWFDNGAVSKGYTCKCGLWTKGG